jgi:hypothetical protein
MLASSATLLSVTVAFDTNAIQTHPREFASPAVRRLTATARDHLKLRWLVPEMVRLEREQQMREEALKLLRAKANFEFLTQTTFPVTTALIEQRVAEASARQMAETGLKPLRLKDRHIDWALLFADAAARRGLFAEGDVEGEKGFRDRIIAETFLQLPPKSERGWPQRIFFVTDDKGLTDYVQQRMGQRADVSVIRNINEMANELNTLNAGLQEQAVAGYRGPAPCNQLLFDSPTEGDSRAMRRSWDAAVAKDALSGSSTSSLAVGSHTGTSVVASPCRTPTQTDAWRSYAGSWLTGSLSETSRDAGRSGRPHSSTQSRSQSRIGALCWLSPIRSPSAYREWSSTKPMIQVLR